MKRFKDIRQGEIIYYFNNYAIKYAEVVVDSVQCKYANSIIVKYHNPVSRKDVSVDIPDDCSIRSIFFETFCTNKEELLDFIKKSVKDILKTSNVRPKFDALISDAEKVVFMLHEAGLDEPHYLEELFSEWHQQMHILEKTIQTEIPMSPDVLEKAGFDNVTDEHIKKELEKEFFIKDYVRYEYRTPYAIVDVDNGLTNIENGWNVHIDNISFESIASIDVNYTWQFNKLMEIYNIPIKL